MISMPYPHKKQPPLPHRIILEKDNRKYTFNTASMLNEALARWILRVKTGTISGRVSEQNGIRFTFVDGKLLA
jgi:hypothetical protein